MRRKTGTVLGIRAPAPRVTPGAIGLLVGYVGLPILGGLVLVDVAIWAAVRLIWGGCYGLWCWF